MLISFEEVKEEFNKIHNKGRFKILKDDDGNYIDKSGNIITSPEVVQGIESLYEKYIDEELTCKEVLRLGRLLKYGDKAIAKNKCVPQKKEHPDNTTLSSLNKQETKKEEVLKRCQKAIDYIFDGKNPIAAIAEVGLSPRAFFFKLKENKDLKDLYIEARECLAEFCLYKREKLEEQLLSGALDSSTYSTISADYKYLAGKLYPKYYGDSKQQDVTITHRAEIDIDPNKIQELNKLLQGDKTQELTYNPETDSYEN